MEEPFLVIGRVAAPHGLRGELRADILTDFPERFRRTTQIWVGSPPTRYRVVRARLSGRQAILKLEGVERREQVDELRGQIIQVPESDAEPLPEGQYYWHQIIGLRVRDAEGRSLGSIEDILETGSNDVYVVRTQGREWLLPSTREVIKRIDVEGGEMVVELLPGMGPGA